MAKELGITNTALSDYERGERDPNTPLLYTLAGFYNVSIDWLFGRSGLYQSHLKQIDLIKILKDNKYKLNINDSPLTQEQRQNILRMLDKPFQFRAREKQIPVMGIIWDGMHILAKDNWWGILEIPQDIEVDFAIEVKGDSMIGAGIIEKDYALCRKVGTAADGSIVVVIEAVDPKYSVATL